MSGRVTALFSYQSAYLLARFVEAKFGGYEAVAGSNFFEYGMQTL